MAEYKSKSGKVDESKGYKGVHGGGGKRVPDKVTGKVVPTDKVKKRPPRPTKMLQDDASTLISRKTK